jgi:ATP-dependent DNA helicase RecQ
LNVSTTQNIHQLLQTHWGHSQFRPLQEEIIQSVLANNDTLALLPTGGGKSLCFQVPALAMGGTCLVVSPLVSLMNDQVKNLRDKGISAVAISAALHHKEVETALNNAVMGHVQFLYVSPERLQNQTFQNHLSHLPITLIAVDEAHCISQWGYDFRPSYLKVSELREYFPEVPIIALTASATSEVVQDIQLKLEFKNGQVFRQSFTRKNLRYVVQKEENKFGRLLKIIGSLGGSGIVYVRNRKKTEDVAKALNKNNISSMAYHAGLKYNDRQTIQQNWIDNKLQVICATNAFGMGIDKPDVRFVVHLDIPESLENYFQEAGRAGRDGKTAYATLLFTPTDQQKLLDNIKIVFPEIDFIKQVYQAICNYYQIAVNAGEGISVELDIEKICASYNLHAVPFYNSLKFLEKENYISILDAGFESSKVMILSDKDDLYAFQLKYEKYDYLIKTLLRSYGGLFEQYVHVNEKELASRIKGAQNLVLEQLYFLNSQKIISYIPQTNLPKIIFLQNRVNIKILRFDPANYEKLKKNYLERINSIINYTNNNLICRNIQLLQYFNEFDFSECGHCDVCIIKRPKDHQKIKEKILGVIKQAPLNLTSLKEKMKNFSDEVWVKVLNELVDDGILTEKEGFFHPK